MRNDALGAQDRGECLGRFIGGAFESHPTQAESGRVVTEEIHVHPPAAQHGRKRERLATKRNGHPTVKAKLRRARRRNADPLTMVGDVLAASGRNGSGNRHGNGIGNGKLSLPILRV